MKGNIRELVNKKGIITSYQIQIYTPGSDGQLHRYFETIKGHKADAQRRLRELLSGLDKGVSIPIGKLTVTQHLDRWFNGYVKTSSGVRTVEAIHIIINRHLSPALGSIILQKLTPQAIQEYYGTACEKLSARTVNKQHRVLSQSLKYAVRQGYLGRNPCDMVTPPRPVKKPMRTLTPSEVEHLLEVSKDNFIYPIIYFGVSTGLRQAEILGLRWRDIDLDMLSISVNRTLYKRNGITDFKEPKTALSRRRISMTPKLAAFLREYKANREWLYIQVGRLLSLDDLVFSSVNLQPLHASVLSHNFHRLTRQAGLDGVRFHDLRHTFASLMLLRGISPKVISDALGHAP